MKALNHTTIFFILLLGFLSACTEGTSEDSVTGEEDIAEVADCDHRYADYDGPKPPGVPEEDLYYLNQDWPETPVSLPTNVTERLHSFLPITSNNVTDLQYYLRALVYEQLVPSNFSQRNTNWFAVPNMGRREAMHGMYDGNNIGPLVWDDLQVDEAYNFTTDLYNEVSAYTIGQVWGDCSRAKNDPKISLETNQFPEGSIVIKLAMTELPLEQAPFLEGAFSWDVYGTAKGGTTGSGMEMIKTHLIQMDMIIKDSVLAPETGWLFTTLVYDRDAMPVDMPAGTPAEKVGLYKMTPLGVMWGNDPDVLTRAELKETVLNRRWLTDPPAFIENTLGLSGRLSGPIDDVGGRGSCMQCHASAEWNTAGIDDKGKYIFNILNYPRSSSSVAEKTKWMQNFKGFQSYASDSTYVPKDVLVYITDTLGITPGPEWIGMDYDFVMTAAALNAMESQGKTKGENMLIGKFH